MGMAARAPQARSKETDPHGEGQGELPGAGLGERGERGFAELEGRCGEERVELRCAGGAGDGRENGWLREEPGESYGGLRGSGFGGDLIESVEDFEAALVEVFCDAGFAVGSFGVFF